MAGVPIPGAAQLASTSPELVDSHPQAPAHAGRTTQGSGFPLPAVSLAILAQQIWPTTVPVPEWPGSGAKPGFVFTTTTCGVLPEIVGPDLLIELATSTAM